MTLQALQGLREVRLYGPLRAQFGRSHWLAVDSPAEAVRALCVLHAGFRDALLGHTGPGYRVLVGEGLQADARDATTLALRAGGQRVIRIAPVLHAGKRGGIGNIIAGAVLLVAAPYMAGALYAAGASVATIGSFLTGASLLAKASILGGVVQLLSPQRQRNGGSADREVSYSFGGVVNVTSPGGPVPLIIGRMIVGSVTISAGISTDDAVAPPDPTGPWADRPADEPPSWRDLEVATP